MERKILIGEAIFQTIVSFISLLYVVSDYIQSENPTEFFIALLFIGISNVLGFLVRISLFASKFHRYYFFGVLIFFQLLFVAVLLFNDSKIEYVLYFMGIGGVLFNIYYLIYGFYNVKTMQQKKTER
ncbi:hypothetical protein [Chryseobacterium sp. EO14]|uniref:hypothetical protein n=1 Tax=Chryseobacterium sp. EO14 TaxID=2950551 RepID=UPI00210CCC8C|nr:hypothetical protein [Chryseobacterium sp. EO14]MCQ4141316.1 hypothetical protein [Chryseobacterium sp. EO14]